MKCTQCGGEMYTKRENNTKLFICTRCGHKEKD